MKTVKKTGPVPVEKINGPAGVQVPGQAVKGGPGKKPDKSLVKDVYVKLRDADASAVHKRLSNQILPWGVGAAVAGSAVAGSRMNYPASLIAGAFADACVIAGLYIPKAVDVSFAAAMARWAREHPAHTVLCGVAALTWYTAAVILGVGSAPELMAAGLAGMYLLAARWWNAYRLGYPGEEVLAEVKEEIKEIIDADPEEDIDIDAIVSKWEKKVSCHNGILAGTRLADRKDHPAGSSYLLYIVGGRHTLEEVQNAMPRVATAIGVPLRNLLVEDVPPTEENPDPDPAILKFQVITRSPIRKTVLLEGPRWRWIGKDLIVDMGPFADGVGQAPWRTFSENSFWGGVVIGTQGSGKSALIDALAISFLDTGLIHVIYIDPQDGGSSPGLFECAGWSIGNDLDQQENVLLGLEALVRYRAMENSARLHTSGFTPSRERPAILTIVDECHLVFNAANARRWGMVARVGRKVGVAILAASQEYGLATFGADDALRQSLETANSAILRLGKNQASLISGTNVDPSKFPQVAGYGTVRAVSPEYNRAAPFRGPYARDDVRMTMMRAAAAKMPPLDRLAVGALDNDNDGAYSRRFEALEESKAKMEQELRLLEAGIPIATPKPPVVESGPMGPDLETIEGEYVNAPTVHGLDGVKRVIFEGIATGTTDTASLLDRAKIMGFTSESWFFEALRELQADGMIHSVKKGIYELGAA